MDREHSPAPIDPLAHVRRLRRTIDRGQDDLLATIQLVSENDDLVRPLFDQLVDRLLDGLFADLRSQHLGGSLDDGAFALELMRLTHDCRTAGLTPVV